MNSGLNVISHHNAFARRKGGAGLQSPASPEPILRRLSSGVRGRMAALTSPRRSGPLAKSPQRPIQSTTAVIFEGE